MDVSQLRRLKELKAENAPLKRMHAELSLTHHALQDAVEKAIGVGARSELVQVLIKDPGISVRQACCAGRLARSAYYAPRRPRDDSAVIAAIRGFVGECCGRRARTI